MRSTCLWLVVTSLLLCGCTSASPDAAASKDADPRIFDFRKKLDEDPTKCAHAWQQIGVHPYQRFVNGMPMTELCSITRCPKCGAVRHDCQRRR
jgi:hypothetical protein